MFQQSINVFDHARYFHDEVDTSVLYSTLHPVGKCVYTLVMDLTSVHIHLNCPTFSCMFLDYISLFVCTPTLSSPQTYDIYYAMVDELSLKGFLKRAVQLSQLYRVHSEVTFVGYSFPDKFVFLTFFISNTV